jgi:hypothetical protein
MGKKCYRDLSRECVGEECMAYQIAKESKVLGFTPPSGCVFIMSAALAGTHAMFEVQRALNDMGEAGAGLGGMLQKLILEKVYEARIRKAEAEEKP